MFEHLPGGSSDIMYADPENPRINGLKRSDYYFAVAESIRSGKLLPKLDQAEREKVVAFYENAAKDYAAFGQ